MKKRNIQKRIKHPSKKINFSVDRKLIKDFFVFINTLKGHWFINLNFFLLILTLTLLPVQGYYSELQLTWERPKVLGAHFFIPPPVFLPVNIGNLPFPQLTAKSSLVIDVASSMILYKNSYDVSLPQASTTKIMTALVSLENYLLNQVFEVPDNFREGQNIKLEKGEKITVENLLYGLLISSGNDAAEVLAANFPGGRTKFVEEMNNKAQSLNLKNTHFVNPSGVDEGGQYSSAIDLARLSIIAIQNPFFSRTVATPSIKIESVDGKFVHKLNNINSLLSTNPVIKGIKTGQTLAAGECFVGLAQKNGRQVITVVLGSKDRFKETTKLVDWTFANYQWQSPI